MTERVLWLEVIRAPIHGGFYVYKERDPETREVTAEVALSPSEVNAMGSHEWIAITVEPRETGPIIDPR